MGLEVTQHLEHSAKKGGQNENSAKSADEEINPSINLKQSGFH